jgi:hypothetical protein
MDLSHIDTDDTLLTPDGEAAHTRDVSIFLQPLLTAIAALPYLQDVWSKLSTEQKLRLAFELHIQLRLRELDPKQTFEPALSKLFTFMNTAERNDFLLQLQRDLAPVVKLQI